MASSPSTLSLEAGSRSTGQLLLRLLCPSCRTPGIRAQHLSGEGMSCALCGYRFQLIDGIFRALPPERRKIYERFLEDYSTIRKAEGRGSEESAYYLALPYEDTTGKHSAQWAIRGRTYRYFERQILPEFERERPNLDILDLGAGNGWLSYRLSRKNHRPVAVDILTDPLDGLAAAKNYRLHLKQGFPLVEAEFDRLPFENAQFDLAIFNSSLHYSTNYHHTLKEARRCLRPTGHIVVMDSPIYKRWEHGDQMRRERHREFEARYGFSSDSIPSIEFLHQAVLEELADYLQLQWRIYRPWYGLRWHLRPWKARLMGLRAPSRFWILIGSWEES